MDGRDPAWIPGLASIGTAQRFDGDDYVVMPETTSLRPKQVTVEAWVRAPTSPGLFEYVLSKGGDRCEAGSFGLCTSNNGGVAFYVYDGKKWWRSPCTARASGTASGTTSRASTTARPCGCSSTAARSAPARRLAGRSSTTSRARALYLGAYRGACDLTFEGDVDEIRLWNAELSITALWDEITGSLHLEPAAPSLPDAAGDWYDAGLAGS